MTTIALVSCGLLVLVAVEQVIAVAAFVRYCRRRTPPNPAYAPEVLVVLPVRGADDTLGRCVEALAEQDYDNYRVRVVFDSESDPGWHVIDEVLVTQPGLPIEIVKLREPHSRCSLKCSAVHQATEELDDCQVVAFLDSDVVPHRTWLRELVAPLADETVGVAHGNRWYLPPGKQWGSLVRYCWNTAAIVTMFFWGMPWGGTLAIKRRILEGSDIRDRWLRAGCEDVPMVPVLRKLGLTVRFVPSLTMVDRHEVPLGHCLRFIDRQMVWARLYYPACWWVSNVWQVVIAASLLTAGVSSAWGLATGQFRLFAGPALVLLGTLVLATYLVRWVERTLLPRGAGPAVTLPLKTLAAIVLTNIGMVRVILVSLLTRAVEWRGIIYHIGGPWHIEMEQYRPYFDDIAIPTEPELAATQSPSLTT